MTRSAKALSRRSSSIMQGSFARASITPPLGTRLTGFGGRDRERGCTGIHDDLFVRALSLAQDGEEVLILGFDLLFFSREEADRIKGAIGRRFGLAPRQTLLNTSHTHTGPKVGKWQWFDPPSDPQYLDLVERATLQAVAEARSRMEDLTLTTGCGQTKLPMNRRRPMANGKVEFRPYPEGAVCDALPVALFRKPSGEPVCLLFSVSCHPSTIGGFEVSADFPGVAMKRLDDHLGKAVSLFLQGTGGDAKPRVAAHGDQWGKTTWNEVEAGGKMVAEEVLQVLKRGLRPVQPQLRAASVETEWPMQPNLGRAGFEALLADPQTDLIRRAWAQEMATRLKRGLALPTSVPVTIQGVKLGEDVRLAGLEGEAVAEWGLFIREFYAGGITFPLSYTNGAQLYLPISRMIDEGGYEVDSYTEYQQPAPLAKGMEEVVRQGLRELQEEGIT